MFKEQSSGDHFLRLPEYLPVLRIQNREMSQMRGSFPQRSVYRCFCLIKLLDLVWSGNKSIILIQHMDNGKNEKQQYLYLQIIQKNYDPEQFQEYIIKAKPNGEDLDNWTLNQLKTVVTEFQKMCSKETENQKEPTLQAEKRKTQLDLQSKQLLDNYLESDESTTKSKMGETSQPFNYDITSDHFTQTIPCLKITPSSLFSAENISIAVTKFQKREGGIFQQSYVCYHVQTAILKKTVERRYSDFEWLKATLEWLHPGVPVPPIAKKGQFRRYDDKHLRKRMMILEMFLNKLLEIPDLRADQVFENFLKLDEKGSFQKYKANYKPKGNTLPFKNVSNLKGSLIASSDKMINGFLFRGQKHFEQVQPMVKSLYKDFKGAATALQGCGSILKGLGNSCETLDRLQRKFKKDHELSYCPNNFFTILNEAVNRLGEQMLNQAMIFRTEYYSLIKYDSLYMLNLLDSFDVLNNIGQKYKEQKFSLFRKKEKLFSEGLVEKWELELKVDKTNKVEAMAAMLPKDTKKLYKVRDVFGLYNHQLYQQVQRYFATKNLQQGAKLQQFCRNETRLCSEMMMIWVDAQTNIMGMRQNKSVLKC